jgi:hypothetical protein
METSPLVKMANYTLISYHGAGGGVTIPATVTKTESGVTTYTVTVIEYDVF